MTPGPQICSPRHFHKRLYTLATQNFQKYTVDILELKCQKLRKKINEMKS